MKTSQHPVLLYLSILLFTACGRNPGDAAQLSATSRELAGTVIDHIQPPPLPFSNPVELFSVDAASGADIQTAHGSRISIPGDAFTYADGTVVNEPVQIQLKEAHSLSEIMLMGVRMSYTVGGKECPFESAGMIEISGKSKSGKEVHIRKGKQLTLKIRSEKKDNNYNFYRFDKNKGEWIEEAKSISAETETASEAESGLKIAGFNEPVYDFDVDVSQVNELNGYFGVMWQATTRSRRFDAATEKQLLATKWENIFVTAPESGKKEYKLTFTGKNEKVTVNAVPVIRGNAGKSIETAILGEKKKSTAAAFMRTATVSAFGLYNYDRYFNNPEMFYADAGLRFSGLGTQPSSFSIFHLVDSRILLPLRLNGTKLNFPFVPAERNRLVAVLADGSVWSVRASGFNSALKVSPVPVFTFAKEAENVQDQAKLQELLLNI